MLIVKVMTSCHFQSRPIIFCACMHPSKVNSIWNSNGHKILSIYIVYLENSNLVSMATIKMDKYDSQHIILWLPCQLKDAHVSVKSLIFSICWYPLKKK